MVMKSKILMKVEVFMAVKKESSIKKTVFRGRKFF